MLVTKNENAGTTVPLETIVIIIGFLAGGIAQVINVAKKKKCILWIITC